MRDQRCREKIPIRVAIGICVSALFPGGTTKAARGPDGPASDPTLDARRIAIPGLTTADLVTLRIRVIALENLLISLLANASDDQLKAAREMASYISPRPGFTPHPLTIHAAAHMVDLIQRSGHFRESESE
jgi:hypothetical protein